MCLCDFLTQIFSFILCRHRVRVVLCAVQTQVRFSECVRWNINFLLNFKTHNVDGFFIDITFPFQATQFQYLSLMYHIRGTYSVTSEEIVKNCKVTQINRDTYCFGGCFKGVFHRNHTSFRTRGNTNSSHNGQPTVNKHTWRKICANSWQYVSNFMLFFFSRTHWLKPDSKWLEWYR